MNLTLGILASVKAFAVVMFGMNLAVLLTWADRRQGAMIQDRVGPNRAVAWIPRIAVQVMALAPACCFAIALLALVFIQEGLTDDSAGRVTWGLTFAHLATLTLWMTFLVIGARIRVRGPRGSFDGLVQAFGDPRRFFYLGLISHLLIFLSAETLGGTALGAFLGDVGYRSGAVLLVLGALFGAGYSAWSIRGEERIGLRLAGLLHPAADGLKTLFKEDFIPPRADKLLHSLAPIISFFPALVVLGVVPFGDTVCFERPIEGFRDVLNIVSVAPRNGMCAEGAAFSLQVIDLNVGILYFFALAGTGVVGAALAGWASDNKYSLLGGLRAASQMVSYEVALGLTVIGAMMVYGTVRIDEMVRWQSQNAWGIFVQPIAFILFFAAAVAESKRIPFDLPEGESEIVAGYFTEYSGMKFAMFFFAEYVAVVSSSALMAALFFGGWHLPFFFRDGIHIAIGDTVLFEQTVPHILLVVMGVAAFVLKTITLCWLQLTIRWTLPRFRYDQLMRLGWRKLLPASLVNILFTALVILAIQVSGPVFQEGLSIVGQITMALLALAGLAFGIKAVLFILEPRRKNPPISASTSAQFAQATGGTKTARMGA